MDEIVSALSSDEERFRAAVEGAPSAMIMVDERSIIAPVNSQTETLFGYERAELLVQDDGRGFDPDSARTHVMTGTSLGVIGMQERVRFAGGKIVIESKPGQGIQVRVTLSAALREGVAVRESRIAQERRVLS